MSAVINGIFRIPVLLTNVQVLAAIGELIRRAFRFAVLKAYGIKPSAEDDENYELVPGYTVLNGAYKNVVELLFPHKKRATAELIKYTLIGWLMSHLLWEVIRLDALFGLPPTIYNTAGRYIGPLVLDSNWRSPLCLTRE